MPELRGVDVSSFTPHPVAPRKIRFKDKTREKQRQLKLEKLDSGGIRLVLCSAVLFNALWCWPFCCTPVVNFGLKWYEVMVSVFFI